MPVRQKQQMVEPGAGFLLYILRNPTVCQQKIFKFHKKLQIVTAYFLTHLRTIL